MILVVYPGYFSFRLMLIHPNGEHEFISDGNYTELSVIGLGKGRELGESALVKQRYLSRHLNVTLPRHSFASGEDELLALLRHCVYLGRQKGGVEITTLFLVPSIAHLLDGQELLDDIANRVGVSRLVYRTWEEVLTSMSWKQYTKNRIVLSPAYSTCDDPAELPYFSIGKEVVGLLTERLRQCLKDYVLDGNDQKQEPIDRVSEAIAHRFLTTWEKQFTYEFSHLENLKIGVSQNKIIRFSIIRSEFLDELKQRLEGILHQVSKTNQGADSEHKIDDKPTRKGSSVSVFLEYDRPEFIEMCGAVFGGNVFGGHDLADAAKEFCKDSTAQVNSVCTRVLIAPKSVDERTLFADAVGWVVSPEKTWRLEYCSGMQQELQIALVKKGYSKDVYCWIKVTLPEIPRFTSNDSTGSVTEHHSYQSSIFFVRIASIEKSKIRLLIRRDYHSNWFVIDRELAANDLSTNGEEFPISSIMIDGSVDVSGGLPLLKILSG